MRRENARGAEAENLSEKYQAGGHADFEVAPLVRTDFPLR